MAELKLPRLPDRAPVKLTITLGSELQQALKDYAYLYQATYGTTEQVVDLILRCPFHSSHFLVTSSRYIAAQKPPASGVGSATRVVSGHAAAR